MTDPTTTSLRRRGLDRQRHVTALSVDVVQSTPLAESLDQERWRDILLTFHDICDRAISRYGGAVAARQGDGLMAHFGLDNPHEDDPRRATLAGLAIQRGLEPLTKEVEAVDKSAFRARVGVHTGPIVITEIGGKREMVGPTAHETARIEASASPGTVVVSRAVRRQLGDEFRFEAQREVELRGVRTPMEISEVLGPASPRSGVPATPMVGRSAERSRLLDMWTAARDGLPGVQAVLITGEAGIGKSRLADILARAAALDRARPLVFETRAFDSTLPLHPISAALEHQWNLVQIRNEEDRYRALLDGLTEVGAEAAVPALAQLVGLSRSLLGEAVAADPSVVRELTLQGALGWISAIAASGPTMVVFEDLQWADEATIELIGRLLDFEPSDNLMLILTARAGFTAPWPGAQLLHLELGPLPPEDVVRLAEFTANEMPLGDEQLARLIVACDGNPLYVEQLLGMTQAGWLEDEMVVPESLDRLLTTIIEAPDVDQGLLGLLATVGRRIDLSFAADVLGLPPAEVDRRLSELCERGILEQVSGSGRPAFVFHHALVQSAAYEHQLPSDRRRAHEQVADAIVRTGGDIELDHRSIARHLDLAARHADALPYYLEASASSLRRGAVLEGRRLAERGLELLTGLPADRKWNDLEIELQLQLGLCIMSSEGYGSADGAASAKRARELIHPGSRLDLAIRALIDVYSYFMARGRRDDEAEVLDQVRGMIGNSDQAHLVDQLEALHIWHLGRLGASYDLYVRVIDRLEQEDLAGIPEFVSLPADNLAAAYTQMGHICWHLGDADASFNYIDKALKRARSLDGSKSPFNEAWATSWLSYLQVQSGDIATALETTSESLQFCTRKGLLMWGGITLVYQTIAQANLEPSDEIEASLTALIDAIHGMGVVTMTPYFLLQRAQLRASVGRLEDALAGFTEAIETAERNQEVQEVADAYRLRGVTQIAMGRPVEAVGDLATAARIAADQGAVIFGIRALSDLIELTDRSLWPDTSVEHDLAALLDRVATPSRYSEVARARALLQPHP